MTALTLGALTLAALTSAYIDIDIGTYIVHTLCIGSTLKSGTYIDIGCIDIRYICCALALTLGALTYIPLTSGMYIDIGCIDIGCINIGCIDIDIGCIDIDCIDIGCIDTDLY